MFRSQFLVLLLVITGLAFPQSGALLFDDVKLYYQRPGETKFRDDKGVLALDGSQKVMLVLKDNRPLFILRYESITGMSFEEKNDRTLSIRYGGDAGPSGSVRMELNGKWRDILETLKAQSGKQVEIVLKH